MRARLQAVLAFLYAALLADPAPLLKPRTTPRLTDRLAIFGFRLAIFALAAAAFMPDVLNTVATKIVYYHDEHNVLMYEEAARKIIADYHQFPGWNPYFCGGIVELANPPNTALSPDFIFRLIFGTEAGRRITAYFFVIFGMEGTYRLARHHDASVLGAMLGGIGFGCCCYFQKLLSDGWLFMFAYQLIPWAVLSLEAGVREPKWRLLGGVFLAWMVFSGGTYVTMYAVLVLALVWVIETVRAAQRSDGVDSARWWQPTVAFGTIGVVSLGLTAVRVLPMLKVIMGHPRLVDQKDLDTPLTILSWVFLPHSERALAPAAGDFYVGIFVSGLAILALLLADRSAARFMLIALIFGALACGEVTPNAPYVFMRKLPLYSQLRAPFRMTIIVSLCVAVAGARGLTRLEDSFVKIAQRAWKGRPLHPSVTLLAGLLGALVAALLLHRGARDVVQENEIAPNTVYTMDPAWRRAAPFKQARGNRWDAHIWPRIDMGSLMCFEENDLPESPLLRGDLPAEEYADPASGATVQRVYWSPEKIILHVHAPQPAQIFVNQNYHPGWRSNVGVVVDHDKLLTVKVPAGDHRLVLRFIDRDIVIGGLVSLLTLVGFGVYFGGRAARRAKALRDRFRELPWRAT